MDIPRVSTRNVELQENTYYPSIILDVKEYREEDISVSFGNSSASWSTDICIGTVKADTPETAVAVGALSKWVFLTPSSLGDSYKNVYYGPATGNGLIITNDPDYFVMPIGPVSNSAETPLFVYKIGDDLFMRFLSTPLASIASIAYIGGDLPPGTMPTDWTGIRALNVQSGFPNDVCLTSANPTLSGPMPQVYFARFALDI